jgi:hypothetical protein
MRQSSLQQVSNQYSHIHKKPKTKKPGTTIGLTPQLRNYMAYLHTMFEKVKDEVRGVRNVCGEDAQVAAVEVEMQRSLGIQHEPH